MTTSRGYTCVCASQGTFSSLYSLELPGPGGSNVYTQSMFLAKIREKSKHF